MFAKKYYKSYMKMDKNIYRRRRRRRRRIKERKRKEKLSARIFFVEREKWWRICTSSTAPQLSMLDISVIPIRIINIIYLLLLLIIIINYYYY
jgi:hypothetical protein